MSELEDRINSVLNDPKQMEKITKLAQSFMAGGQGGADAEGAGGDKTAGAPGDIPELDPKFLNRLGTLLKSNAPEKKRERELLEAMKPYLSEKRRSKMDRAIRIARIAGIAKLAMGEMGGDGDDKPLSR